MEPCDIVMLVQGSCRIKASVHGVEPARRKMQPRYAEVKRERMERMMLRKTHNVLLLRRDDKAAACRKTAPCDCKLETSGVFIPISLVREGIPGAERLQTSGNGVWGICMSAQGSHCLCPRDYEMVCWFVSERRREGQKAYEVLRSEAEEMLEI